jgi:dsRNA-specific ribonuclease
LQEIVQEKGKHIISYRTINKELGNAKVELWIDNVKRGTATGNKVKNAQMQVARMVYHQLKKRKK